MVKTGRSSKRALLGPWCAIVFIAASISPIESASAQNGWFGGGQPSKADKGDKVQSETDAISQKQKNAARSSVIIKAPPEAVWIGMMEQRKVDPELKYSKSLQGKPAQTEQKFVFPSLFGTATCVINLTEVPGQRIDYKLISSEDFDNWEGSWIISPGPNPGETRLELSSLIELDAPIPRKILNMLVECKLRKNLSTVKHLAEHVQIASRSKPVM